MKDKCNSIPINNKFDITKMHGHMRVELTDINTGEVEVLEEDNMMTNALQEYFRNMGLMNYPNIDQNEVITYLLGGIMGFDEEIDEDAQIIHVPAGHRMVFNGSVGVVNNSAPTELGSYSGTESGMQDDGSFVQTYDFSTSQANGTISCVCLTSKAYGLFGEGNFTSNVRYGTRVDIFSLLGSPTQYSMLGNIFKVDFSDSSIYTARVETIESVKKIVIRQYRVPLTKLDMRSTPSAPLLLSKTEVSVDSDFANATLLHQPKDGNMIYWNVSEYTPVWGSGSWNQYVWTLTPSGTLTKETVLNTYGEDLTGLQAACFDGDYCFFIKAYGGTIDSRKVYVWNRNDDSIISIDNPGGILATVGAWINSMAGAGWDILHRSGDGRIVTTGSNGVSFVADAVLEECAPCNENSTLLYHFIPDTNKLIYAMHEGDVRLYRSQCYIASINNLATPITKTAEKTMKVVYRITFEDTEENAIGEIGGGVS